MQNNYLDFATQVVADAGAIALRYFRSNMTVENKLSSGQFDPVTQADKEVEALIRARITAEFPEHAILGEEQGITAGASDYCWVIDPIDGTRAFISGVPAWGILLGLRRGSELLCGVMHQPYLQETFVADQHACFLLQAEQRERLQTSATEELAEAKLYCTHPDLFNGVAGAAARFQTVAQQCKLQRFGGDCYSYGMLAMGQIDLVIEGDLQPYDIVPLIPIVEAAGGVITDWQGGSAAEGGLVLAAANPALHRRALQVLHNS
ncbi:MAG: histidinol-phosphatase [Pseudomonadales bacterium]